MGTTWWWLDDTPQWTARMLYEHSANQRGGSKARTGGQGIAFARWAGVGSHRYPIGFSGDTYMEWSSLQFQTTFTATAANVLFWWSHDIGGHRSKQDFAAYDPELYLRWLQWGTHAPILRTHPQPDPKVERRPYGYGLPIATYLSDAMRRRARLVPLLATALHAFETSALSPLRSLYIDWPALDGAYTYNDTFLYCDLLVVAPVTTNVSNATQLAPRSAWLPPGSWVSLVDGATSIAGGATGLVISRNHTLWESPAWARAGSMLPIAPKVRSDNALGFASRPSVVAATGWETWLGGALTGAGNVSVSVDGVEDGATSVAAFTMAPDGTSLRLSATLRGGEASTFWEVKGVFRAASVTPCSGSASTELWSIGASSYSPTTMTQTVGITIDASTPPPSPTNPLTVCVQLVSPKGSMVPPAQPTGKGGYVGRRSRAHKLKAMMDDELHNPQQVAMPLVIAVNSAFLIDAAVRSGDYPAAHALLAGFDTALEGALATILDDSGLVGQNKLSDSFKAVASAWLAPYV